MEKIKDFLLRKDNLIIIVLTGILMLVIAWPIESEKEKVSSEYKLWDKGKSNIYQNNKDTVESTLDEEIFLNDGIATDSGIFREEYIISNLEERLEEILSAVQGVGSVKVMITLSSSGEKIVEKDIPLERNSIVENDSTGGNRSTNEMYSQEETVYSTNSNGDKVPYVIKENSARVEGVSVVAEGGGDADVQKNISDVIQALFGIEAHKIKVVKMKWEE
ncbi:MAG: stage III sporulation protein AG [Lachnospiraceae bacterium]|nr:stage III sporulation protein AG [Lachnospiraceae bacterium]